MVELGHYNTLRIIKRVDIGLFLDGGQFGEILLPTGESGRSRAI